MYVAQKPCSFMGHNFRIGDSIEESLVLPEAVNRLLNAGVIAVTGGSTPPSSTSEMAQVGEIKLEVPIVAQEGITSVELTTEQLVAVVAAIQKPEEELLEDVKGMDSADQLLLLAILDGTDPVYEATKARVAEIQGNQESDDEETQGNQESEKVYSKNALERMDRPDLVELATSLGISVSDDMTKKKLVEEVYSVQH